MLEIKTVFFPLRLKISRKEPVQLKIVIKNTGSEKEFVSCEIVSRGGLSLDKNSLKEKEVKRIGEFKPGESTEKYFSVYPKYMVRPGSYPLMIKAIEHFENNYNYPKKEYLKKLELGVD